VSLVIVPEARTMPSLLRTKLSSDQIRWGGAVEGEEWEGETEGMEEEIGAKEGPVRIRRVWWRKGCTDQVTTERFVYVIHRTSERMQLCTGLATFLEFALKAVENMVEGDTTLPWYAHVGAHASHTTESLLLDGWPTSGASGILSSSKVEGSCTIA
jgi:hypothetical protein